MARKTQDDSTSGEQLELIDISPENLKKIKPIARKYKAAQRRRMEAGAEEVGLKGQILAMVKDANLSRLADGSIRFKCDGMTITVTPRDELVKVKSDGDDEGGED